MAECTYTEDTSTPQTVFDNRSMEYFYTKKDSNKAEYTYTEDTSTPTLQLTICLWNTIIPN